MKDKVFNEAMQFALDNQDEATKLLPTRRRVRMAADAVFQAYRSERPDGQAAQRRLRQMEKRGTK